MTDQEAFEKAARGVIAQGRAALTLSGGCRYRTPDGCKCHVGQLIPDDLYGGDGYSDFYAHKVYEGYGPWTVMKKVRELNGLSHYILGAGQIAHDDAAVNAQGNQDFLILYAINLRKVAVAHNLDVSFLDGAI